MIVEDRFRGPPTSGNGGYVSGLFAGLLSSSQDTSRKESAIEVTLRAPIPLDTPMTTQVGEAGATVHHGETLIAEVRPSQTTFESRQPPSWEETMAAAPNAYSLKDNLQDFMPGIPGYHPICFCCGAGNDQGLKVYVAPVGDQVAALWQTQAAWGMSKGECRLSFSGPRWIARDSLLTFTPVFELDC